MCEEISPVTQRNPEGKQILEFQNGFIKLRTSEPAKKVYIYDLNGQMLFQGTPEQLHLHKFAQQLLLLRLEAGPHGAKSVFIILPRTS